MTRHVFFVINCENSGVWLPLTFGDMFSTSLRREGDDWRVVNIASGEALPADVLDIAQGVVITGSRFNCRDRDTLPWFDSLCELIRKISEQDAVKLYGGCFGCQIIAHALGGEVDFNPGHNFLLLAETVKFVDCACAALPAMPEGLRCKCAGPGLRLLVSHGDCVRTLPPSGKLLAQSQSCAVEVYVCGRDNIIACQSHPEFDFKYAIEDRIWKSVVDTRKRLTDEEVVAARRSFEEYDGRDAAAFMAWVSEFLHAP